MSQSLTDDPDLPVVSTKDLQRRLLNVTSDEDLIRILDEIQCARQSVNSKLEQLTDDGQKLITQSLQKSNLLQSQLAPVLASSHDLLNILSDSSHKASQISSKIRSIDSDHTKVKQCLQYVQNVIQLKAAIIGIQNAMSSRDWERASQYVAQARSLPTELIDGEFAKATVPTSEIPDYPIDTIKTVSEDLGALFLREFKKAASLKDMENVTRYFKLFPLIGQEKEGLGAYATFVSEIIITHSRKLLQHHSLSDPTDSPMFYGMAMSRLFENIATIVNQHAPVIERHYGKGKMVQILKRIQDEADTQGGLIIDTFWDERRIDRVLSEIKTYSYPYLMNTFVARTNTPQPDEAGRNSFDDGSVNLKEVSMLVNEASVMLNRWMLYRKFLASRWDSYAPPKDDDKDDQRHSSSKSGMDLPSVVVDCRLSIKVEHKLVPTFETLATFVFRRSVEKAFQLEEFPNVYQKYTEESPLITSVVDDIMYIYNTLIQETISSGELAIVKIVLANFRRILESDYVGIIQRKLRDTSPKQGVLPVTRSITPIGGGGNATKKPRQKTLAGLSEADDHKLRLFLIYLNDLSVTPKYADRIFKGLDIDENVPFDDDASNCRELLSGLSRALETRCTELITDGVSVVFFAVLNNRLRSLCTSLFSKVQYMRSPDPSGAGYTADTSLSDTFAFEWHNIISEFSKVMSPENHWRLMTLAASALAQIFEKWIWSLEGKVNELGAIALDRDISRIIATVSEGRYQLRDKFVRIAQIVMIIGLEEAEEEDEDQDISWALNYEDRLKARMIRVERRARNY